MSAEDSPSEYGKLGMKELLIKSLLPTFEEIVIDSFQFEIDNHLEVTGYFDKKGIEQTMPTSYTLAFRTKNGHVYHITKT